MGSHRAVDYTHESSAAFSGYTDAFRPVAEAIVDRLPNPGPDARVVDLGCGPGEPGLSVLERYPAVELLGVDTSPDMLAIARARAAGLANARFEAMDMQRLDIASDSVDAVVSRFGFLALEDISRSAA